MAEGDDPGQVNGALGSSVANSYISRREQDQQAQDAALDNKFTATISLNGAIVAIFGAAFAVVSAGASATDWIFSVTVLAVFAVNGALTVRYYIGFTWDRRPDLRRLEWIESALSAQTARAWAMRERLIALDENERTLRAKRLACAVSMSLTLADATLIGVTSLTRAFPFSP